MLAQHNQRVVRIEPNFVTIASADDEETPEAEIEASVSVLMVKAKLRPTREASLTSLKSAAGLADELKELAKEGKLGFEPLPLSKVEPPTREEDLRPIGYRPLDGQPTDIPVPTGRDDLTAEFCTKAFRLRGLLSETESVTAVHLKELGVGGGEMSMNFFMRLEVDGEAPRLARQLVAKFSSPKMSALEKAFTFGPEAHFYNDFSIESCGLIRPDAPYVGFQKGGMLKGSSQYCIIQEFCAAPAVLFKRAEGLGSLAHMRLVMRMLARFHARWWNHPQSGVLSHYTHPEKLGGPLPHAPTALTMTAGVLVWKNGLKTLMKCYSDAPQYQGVPKFAAEYAAFIESIRPIVRRRRHSLVREVTSKKPLTLCHGDAHTENVFFGPHYPGGCAFIDFGLVGFGPPMSDVATIIGGGMPIEARRRHEEELVKDYHAALTGEFGVSGFAFDACWDQYEFQLVRPFFQLLMLAGEFKKERDKKEGVFAPNPSEGDIKKRQMYEQLNPRFAAALEDHNWKDKMKSLPITAPYTCRPCC